MLALIEKELKLAGIDYVILTGDTRDREAQVRRFQACEVPVSYTHLDVYKRQAWLSKAAGRC